MSRLHEALKAAAEAQEARVGSGVNGSFPDLELCLETESDARQAEATKNGAWSKPQPFVLDPWEARCSHPVWNPDVTKVPFFAPGSDYTVHIEAFRILGSRLGQLRATQPLKSVLIGSALSGEGKSFIAANLAQVLAWHGGCKVLLVDGNLRNPQLHLALGAPISPGLTEYLRAEADGFSVIQRGPMSNLFFAPAGSPAVNPPQLISNSGFKRFIEFVGPVFDWIIVDSPAALPTADAIVMADVCDGVMMVVNAGKTPFDLAQKSRDALRHRPILGVIMNEVPSSVSSMSRLRKPATGSSMQPRE